MPGDEQILTYIDPANTGPNIELSCGEFEVGTARSLGVDMWQHSIEIHSFYTLMSKEDFDTFPTRLDLNTEFVLDLKVEFLLEKLDEFSKLVDEAGVLETFVDYDQTDELVSFLVNAELLGDYKKVSQACPVLSLKLGANIEVDIEFAADMALMSASEAEAFILNELAVVRMLQTPVIRLECLNGRKALESTRDEMLEFSDRVLFETEPGTAEQWFQRFLELNDQFRAALKEYMRAQCELVEVMDVIDEVQKLHTQLHFLLNDGLNREDSRSDLPDKHVL